MLEVKHKPSGKLLKLNDFWLRDHCRCNDCYNLVTKQRKYNLLDIPADIKAKEYNYKKEGSEFEVKWSDNHISIYDVDFLYNSQVEQVKANASVGRTPWNCSIILQNERHIRFSLPDLITSEAVVKDLVSAIVRYGIAFIDDVPANTTMTEMAIRRVFPIMKTFYGQMFTFTDAQDHADTAYSKVYLGSHTDNTYFCDAAGLQVLHCIQHINGTGGENFFVDGLHAALELKRRNPKAYKMLTTVEVPAEYIEPGQHHKHSAPMIRLNPVTGEIIQLRLNVYDRAVFDTLPQDQMEDFYLSFREFLQIIEDQSSQWTFKLHPGSLVIFDNWRVYHGRHAYTGLRTMTGCYIQRTDFQSKARLLGIID